jgi:nucleoside-diphosphate-sugar epimerase
VVLCVKVVDGWKLLSLQHQSLISKRTTLTTVMTMSRGGSSGDDLRTPSTKQLPPPHDLWIVGAGNLGSRIAKHYRSRDSGSPAQIVTEVSRSQHRLLELADCGFQSRLRESRSAVLDVKSSKDVVICIPPSMTAPQTAYSEEVAAACDLWMGPAGGGKLVFTSSVGVYGDVDGTVDEQSLPALQSPRAQM